MSKQLICTVHYTYSEEGIPNVIKKFVESEFMRARNKAIELLNPHYEEWNEAYDEKVTGEDDMKYYAYIQGKQNEILNKFNKSWIGGVKLFSDEYADIAGKFRMLGKNVTMHMSIKPVE